MTAIRRHLPTIFYAICLLLAIGSFYFTVSETLLTWFFPDELILSQTYHRMGGIFTCTKAYYFHTTVNRLSADFIGCWMAKSAALFSTPFTGWVFGRMVVHIFIPVSVAFLLKGIAKIPFKFGLIVALILYSITLLIIENYGYYLYGLDLAIYGTATATFFILMALFPKSIENKRYFIWFCVVYAINLTSHEVFLAISGFFIPLYAWYHYTLNHSMNEKVSLSLFIKNSFKDRRVRILSAVYLISALITILAPGVGIRQHTWPSTGTFSEGLVYIILASEEMLYFLAKFYVFIILIFLLGVIFRGWFAREFSIKHKLLYALLLSTPFIYILIVGFLIGITPTLWGGSLRSNAFRQLEPLLASLVTNKNMLTQGGFYISRILFLYLGLFLDIFLAGFLVAGTVSKYLKNTVAKKIWPFQTVLFAVVTTIFLFHPDGIGSMRIVPAFFKTNVDLAHYSPQKNKEIYPEHSIIDLVSSRWPAVQAFGSTLFPRSRPGDHESVIVNILVNHYFKTNRGKEVPPAILDLIYDPLVSNSIAVRQDQWKNLMYTLFNVTPKKS